MKYVEHDNITGCHVIFPSVLTSNVIDYIFIARIYTTRVSLAAVYKQNCQVPLSRPIYILEGINQQVGEGDITLTHWGPGEIVVILQT